MRDRIRLFRDRDPGISLPALTTSMGQPGQAVFFFSFFHTNFNLPFKFWEVFFFNCFSPSLFKILFSPSMLVPLSPHPAFTCWSQLLDFGLELAT